MDPFNPDNDLQTEKYPGSKKIRFIRCIPCGDVIYDIQPGDSDPLKRSKWVAMALHLSLMHGSKLISSHMLRVVDTSKRGAK